MFMISSTTPDWEREKIDSFWTPGKKLLKAIRDYQSFSESDRVYVKLLRKMCVVRYRFWSVITGADIPLNINLGGGLLIPHPNGIVLHPKCIIGPNCLIHQQVTIGVSHDSRAAPSLGGHVDIGAGAKIIGNINIGKHVKIGANAVVIRDVPDYAIVAGVPAKIIGTTSLDAIKNDH